jgi:hypothetical protein
LQAEKPSYRAGATKWWSEVISRTAIGAGADAEAVEKHLGTIVPTLMKRFSSREGYCLFDDTLPTRGSFTLCLGMSIALIQEAMWITVRTLRTMGVRTGLITNADVRISALLYYHVACCVFTTRVGDVLLDLGISEYLSPVLISETERVEKPSISIFLAACARGCATPPETVHIGDDFRE